MEDQTPLRPRFAVGMEFFLPNLILPKRESILTLCVYFAGGMPVSLHIFYGSAWSIGRSSLGSFLLLLILLRMTGFIGSAKAVEIEFLIVLLLWFVDLDKIVIIV